MFTTEGFHLRSFGSALLYRHLLSRFIQAQFMVQILRSHAFTLAMTSKALTNSKNELKRGVRNRVTGLITSELGVPLVEEVFANI